MNSIVGPKLEVIFAERGTCESREQYTRPNQGNVDTDSNTKMCCYPNPLQILKENGNRIFYLSQT